jgi:GSCFA family
MNEYSKTLVINDGESLGNSESVSLMIKAVYQGTALESDIPEITNYVLGNQHLLQGHDAVLLVIQKYLIEKLNQNPLWSVKILDGMKILAAHIDGTIENRRAYSTNGRLNPNAVFWPDATDEKHPKYIYDEIPWAEKFNFIDSSTPIGSAGSCFAMEIAHRLQNSKFNYVVTENRAALPHDPKPIPANSSAAWGIIFNVPALRQLVSKAFGVHKMPKLLWRTTLRNKPVFADPFREDMYFETIEQYEAEYESHLQACREALLRCKVFVMTLGLNEVWTLKSDGTVFSRCPWSFSAALTEHRVLTVEENVKHLQVMFDLWKSYNPELKLIVTVSPVPLHATFRGDQHHVISANCHSKSTLRVAADEFTRKNKDVFYFPSYETVMYCTKNPWAKDQRHVTREAVDGVMKLFAHMFLKSGDINILTSQNQNAVNLNQVNHSCSPVSTLLA